MWKLKATVVPVVNETLKSVTPTSNTRGILKNNLTAVDDYKHSKRPLNVFL